MPQVAALPKTEDEALSHPSNGHERETVFRMLSALQIPRDSVLLVHSSFKSFRLDGYNADLVLDALVEYMQPGTLLMPTMSWRFVKPVSPYFDELATPCNTGVLAEKFRQNYATRRSLHPTHSVAGRGKHLDYLLGSHHLCTTPCGADSPFGRMVELNGHIVMMGVGIDCCTLIHHVEEMIAPALYVKPESETETYTCRDRQGKETIVKLRRHLFLPRDYWQFQDKLAAQRNLKIFRCDNSICLGFPATKMRDLVAETLINQPDAIIAKSGQRYRLM